MEQEKWYRVLWMYLRSHVRAVAVFALFTAIFAGVFALYAVEVEAVLYAAALCVLAGIIMLGTGFFRFWQVHEARREVLHNLPVWTASLPAADSPEGADFRAMAEKMRECYGALVTETESARRESMDYYTAWVHQIKTPIAVMQMTLQGEDTPEHRALALELFRIRQYAEMALCYTRLGEGVSDLVIRSYDLDGIIRQAVRKYAPVFVQKRLALGYEGTGAQVLTDEKWLSFILEQLLDNALKYTQTGSVTIAVSEQKVLSIADTGIGIARSDVPRIFEKGFTGYNGRTDKNATGLGLYLCRTAAQKLGHRLWCESTPGQGSVFYLDLHTDPLEVE